MKHAYIVVHLYGPDSALLWSPEVMDRKYIRRPGTKLGEWFEVDEEKSTLIECAPFCETRIRNMRLELCPWLWQCWLFYTDGFGEGTYVHVEFFDSREFQVILNLFDVKWVVVEQKLELISRTDLHHFSGNCRFNGLKVVKGFVVQSSGKCGEIFNDDYKICLFTLGDDEKELRVGDFVKFIAVKNFSLKNIAVNVYDIGNQKGIELLSVKPTLRLRVTNWNFSKWSRMVDVPGLCTRISNENTDNETVPDNSKPLVIEYSHSYKNFFVPKMPSNPYLDDKPVRSNHYERPVIIKKVNPKHSNIAPPLTGQYSSRKSNTAVSETSSTKSTSQHHEMDMSTLCSKFRSFNVES